MSENVLFELGNLVSKRETSGKTIVDGDNKILDQGGLACRKVKIETKLSSNGEQSIENDKVDDNSNNVQEFVCGTKAKIYKTLLNSNIKQIFILEKWNTKYYTVTLNDVGSVSDVE